MSCYTVRYRRNTVTRLSIDETGALVVTAMDQSAYPHAYVNAVYPPRSHVEQSVATVERVLDSWMATGEIP